MNCPAISIAGETSVSGSLQAMDCQIEQSVEVGYNRLFGAGGVFAETLTVLLTVYVALLAYGFLTGRTRLTVAMMSPRLVTMALVITFVTVWPAYHTIFYGLFMYGPDRVASALLGQSGSAVMNFAQTLDGLFVRFADIARSLEESPTTGVSATAPMAMPVVLFWLSGLILLVTTLGLLILTRLVLFLLLVLGPLFIVLGLFNQTRGLFNAWLRTAVLFALAPMLTVLGGTAALTLFVPLLNYIALDPQSAVTAVQPIVVLFMGSLVYAAFLATLMWVAASLVKDWQAALRDKSDRGHTVALWLWSSPRRSRPARRSARILAMIAIEICRRPSSRGRSSPGLRLLLCRALGKATGSCTRKDLARPSGGPIRRRVLSKEPSDERADHDPAGRYRRRRRHRFRRWCFCPPGGTECSNQDHRVCGKHDGGDRGVYEFPDHGDIRPG